MRSSWTRVGGLRTHARVLGKGPPLLLLHGLGCSSEYFDPLQRALSGHFTTFALDMAGFGQTRAPRNSYLQLERLSEHVAQWLVEIGFERLPVLGHSLGGEVALDLAARFPERVSQLVLCAPTGIPENPSVLAQMWNLMRDTPLERPSLIARAVQAYLLCGTRRMLAMAREQKRHLTGPQLERIHVPTLVIVGALDPVIRPYTAHVLKRDISQARTLVLPRGTHALHDSCTLEVKEAVLEFLRLESS